IGWRRQKTFLKSSVSLRLCPASARHLMHAAVLGPINVAVHRTGKFSARLRPCSSPADSCSAVGESKEPLGDARQATRHLLGRRILRGLPLLTRADEMIHK